MIVRRVGISAVVLLAFLGLPFGAHADCTAPPTVTIQAQLDQEGIVTGTVTYGFPDTTAQGQRSLQVTVQEPGGSGILAGFSPGDASGTWPFTHVSFRASRPARMSTKRRRSPVDRLRSSRKTPIP